MNVDIITKEDLKYLNQKIESLEGMMKSFLSNDSPRTSRRRTFTPQGRSSQKNSG